jgi:hypothetical protein
MHASFFFGGKKEGKKPLGLRETCNYRCTLYQHLPRSLHPRPGISLYLCWASKVVGVVCGTTFWADGPILIRATVKNHENPLIRRIKVQDYLGIGSFVPCFSERIML